MENNVHLLFRFICVFCLFFSCCPWNTITLFKLIWYLYFFFLWLSCRGKSSFVPRSCLCVCAGLHRENRLKGCFRVLAVLGVRAHGCLVRVPRPSVRQLPTPHAEGAGGILSRSNFNRTPCSTIFPRDDFYGFAGGVARRPRCCAFLQSNAEEDTVATGGQRTSQPLRKTVSGTSARVMRSHSTKGWTMIPPNR